MISTFSVPSTHLIFATSLLASLVGFGMYFDHAASDGVPERAAAALAGELARESASLDVRRVAHWAVSTQDHAGMPFVVIDKVQARLYAFDPRGRLRGSAPVLLGAGHADAATPPDTPAGRFEASTIASARGGGIVWTNAQTQLALYGLPAALATEQRWLDSPRAEDKRVSQGSLHVAADFYRDYLRPLQTQPSIAYVLPETMPMEQVFDTARPNPALVERAEGARTRRPS